jgi:hypothetical protein
MKDKKFLLKMTWAEWLRFKAKADKLCGGNFSAFARQAMEELKFVEIPDEHPDGEDFF